MTVSVVQPPIDPSLSVNEILRRYPASIGILKAHGIDTCCGGATTLRAAALEAHIDFQALLQLMGITAAERSASTPAVLRDDACSGSCACSRPNVAS